MISYFTIEKIDVSEPEAGSYSMSVVINCMLIHPSIFIPTLCLTVS